MQTTYRALSLMILVFIPVLCGCAISEHPANNIWNTGWETGRFAPPETDL